MLESIYQSETLDRVASKQISVWNFALRVFLKTFKVNKKLEEKGFKQIKFKLFFWKYILNPDFLPASCNWHLAIRIYCTLPYFACACVIVFGAKPEWLLW